MRLSFLPRETSFFDFFDQHIALTITGTREFQALIADGDTIGSRAQSIKKIESETDTITHRCIEAPPAQYAGRSRTTRDETRRTSEDPTPPGQRRTSVPARRLMRANSLISGVIGSARTASSRT